MKTICFIFLISLLTACNSANSVDQVQTDSIVTPDTTAMSSDASPITESSKMSVEDEDGNPLNLDLNSDTTFITYATWCPHSNSLLQSLNDKEYSSLFDNGKVVFILDRNEIDDFVSQISGNDAVESTGLTKEELDNKIKELEEQKKYSKVVVPSKLEELQNFKYYYLTDPSIKMEGFPYALNKNARDFVDGPMTALAKSYYNSDTTLFIAFLDHRNQLEKNLQIEDGQ